MQSSTLLALIPARCAAASGGRRTSPRVLMAAHQHSTLYARTKLFGLVMLALSLDISVGCAIDPESPVENSVARTPVSEVESIIRPLSVRTSSGDRTVLRFSSDERPTVLYFISPACVWCERNVASIRQLAQQRGQSYRFVAISVASLPARYGQ